VRAAWALAVEGLAPGAGAAGAGAAGAGASLALVFFSPSGFEAALAAGVLGALGAGAGAGVGEGEGEEGAGDLLAGAVFVAIGSTTAAALAARGVRVAAVAASPDSQGLAAAIAAAFESGRR
jgi:uroporphyrinogen-III synthase